MLLQPEVRTRRPASGRLRLARSQAGWALRLVLPVCLVVAAAVAAGGLWRVLGRTTQTPAAGSRASLELGTAAAPTAPAGARADTPSSVRPAAPPAGSGAITAPTPVRVTAPVAVMNAGAVAGLAGRTANALRAQGVRVASIGNLSTSAKPAVGTVYYAPGAAPQARTLARIAGAASVAPAPAWLGARGSLVLVVVS